MCAARRGRRALAGEGARAAQPEGDAPGHRPPSRMAARSAPTSGARPGLEQAHEAGGCDAAPKRSAGTSVESARCAARRTAAPRKPGARHSGGWTTPAGSRESRCACSRSATALTSTTGRASTPGGSAVPGGGAERGGRQPGVDDERFALQAARSRSGPGCACARGAAIRRPGRRTGVRRHCPRSSGRCRSRAPANTRVGWSTATPGPDGAQEAGGRLPSTC